jgi:GNAT superfamily N-acetyltransferase
MLGAIGEVRIGDGILGKLAANLRVIIRRQPRSKRGPVSDEREEPSIAITDFAPGDEAAALTFCRQIFHGEGWRTEFTDQAIAAGFDRLRDLFLLAKLHGAIIGCGALKELSTDDALLTRFLVASSHRGSGLATKLFDALFERAHVLGYSTVVLDVNRKSASAIRFYEKQGMEEFIPTPHPRWLESAPEELQYARYLRKKVNRG